MINGRRIDLVASYQRLDELEENLKPFSFRILKQDCLDLPDKIWTKRYIQLTEEQQKVYNQMRTTALALLNGKMMTTNTVLTQLMRLHQITCGHMKADDGSIIELKNERLNALIDILEEAQGKVIIWANYLHDIEAIKKTIIEKYGKDSVVTYYGATDIKDRQTNIKNFQTNDKVKYLIGNPQTGGYGITLTAANTVVYYSNNYDLEKRLQSEDRAHRIGQKNKVTYIDLIAEDTVDEKIVKSLRNKVNIATEIMGEELKEWI
jgi:SNF2 family DNA or RNA helicase